VEHDRVAAAVAEQVAYYRQAAAEFERHAHAALEMLRLGTAAGFQIKRSRARVIGSSSVWGE